MSDLPPFTLQWHITNACNLRCKHCYQEEYTSETSSFNRKKQIIRNFTKFCNKLEREPKLALTGGEPFLHKKELFNIIDFCSDNFPNLRISIMTNGTLITKNDVKKLVSFGNIDYVQVSLDGALKKTHDSIRGKGSYDKAVESLKMLDIFGIDTAVMFVFHKLNYKEVPNLINLCESIGVRALGITELVPEGSGSDVKHLMLTPEETYNLMRKTTKKQVDIINKKGKLRIDMKRPLWVLLQQEFKQYEHLIGGGCAAGFSGLALMPNEDVMPCRRMNIIIGNLKKDTFFDIWYSSRILWMLRDRDTKGECASCRFNTKCSGCKAVSYWSKGSILKKDPMCWL